MTDLEKKLVADALKEVGEVLLPALIDAEITKIPAPYEVVAVAIWTAMKPALVAAIDAKIAAL